MKNLVLPDKVESLWTETASRTDFPELDNNINTDVVIIGAGIAGLNAAYFLRRQSLRVVVIESTYIASGTSGNTTAKVTSQHELKYAYIKQRFGKESAQVYADSNQWVIKELERIIKKESIDCDFHILPAYTYTRTKKGAEEIELEVDISSQLGLPASFVLSENSIPFKIYGAIKFDNQAYFHPLKYLFAIAKKVNTKGSYIFEKTTAVDIIEKADRCEVITDKKSVKAKYAIVATNFPFYDKNGLFDRMPQIRSYVLAEKPNAKAPKGMFIGIGKDDLSFRPQMIGKEEWLLTGGVHHLSEEGGNANDHYLKLKQYAEEFFEIKSVNYKWAAQDSMPMDKVPYIGRMPHSKRIFVTTGYGAWGMTTSFVSAKILTDLIIGKDNDWIELYNPSRIKPGIKKPVKHLIIKKRGDLMDLKADEGKIIDRKGQKIAVYKDKKGTEITLSARCTHLGCIVNWNGKDKTWDCPCHGSRFTKEGKVMSGPAVKDLPRI